MNVQFSFIDLLLVSPAIVMFLASVVPILIKVLRGNREQNPFATLLYAFTGLIAAAGLTISNYGLYRTAFQKALIFDGISLWSNLIVIFVTAICLLYSRENINTMTRQFSEYVFLLINAAIGMMIVAWSNDLIITFIGIEIMSLCLYILIALSNEQKLSKEAAFKYFVLGSFASAVFLYGVSFVYGTVGYTYLQDIASVAVELLSYNRLFLLGLTMVILGFAFKVSIFPFHAWAPDVYQGAATPVTTFMAAGVKVVTFVALLRITATGALMGEHSDSLVVAMEWLAAFTIVAGNVAALMQDNFKRMLAYSSVAHSGYAFIGVIASGLGGDSLIGASGVIFYVFSYTLMTVGAFGVICLFEKREDTRVQISDLKGLSKKSPWMALSISIFMLSLAGIPPTVGFFGKFFVFSAAVEQGLYWLAIWGVIGSIVSVYYYLRPMVYMYMSEEEGADALEGFQLTRFAVVLSAVLIIGIGLASNPFYEFIQESVSQIFG